MSQFFSAQFSYFPSFFSATPTNASFSSSPHMELTDAPSLVTQADLHSQGRSQMHRGCTSHSNSRLCVVIKHIKTPLCICKHWWSLWRKRPACRVRSVKSPTPLRRRREAEKSPPDVSAAILHWQHNVEPRTGQQSSAGGVSVLHWAERCYTPSLEQAVAMNSSISKIFLALKLNHQNLYGSQTKGFCLDRLLFFNMLFLAMSDIKILLAISLCPIPVSPDINQYQHLQPHYGYFCIVISRWMHR